MARVFVIYGEQSKQIRQVVLATKEVHFEIIKGEAYVETPLEEYAVADGGKLRQWLNQKIGAPANSGRCIEVDKNGTVVNVYIADPLLDKPLNPANTMEYHETATIGDAKVKGQFPPPPVIPPDPNSPLT